MHGRLKVKSTAQQQEEKRKEREQKLKLFRLANAKVLQKRENKEFDEEALSITGQILVANPDYYTLWCYRKEIFEHLKSQQDDTFQRLCTEELCLTENCLAKNPKSYGAWHHRLWILKIMPTPDWELMLKRCDAYLQLDERNFNAWDHRREVCKLAQTNLVEELNFTLKKIESNFSNYSAWHYRSSLLPLTYPDPGPKETKSVREDKLLQEYDLVQNATFTDPTDQSAWFYHRWLLGRAEQRRELVLLYVSRDRCMVVVILSKPLKVGEEQMLELRINNENVTQCWETTDMSSSSIWVHKVPAFSNAPTQVQVLHYSQDAVDVLECILESETEKWAWLTNSNAKLYRSEQSAVAVQVLEQELESCQQLQDLEPNNKWPVLTCVLLMRALDIQRYHSLILESLEKLELIDSKRCKYYQDFNSQFR